MEDGAPLFSVPTEDQTGGSAFTLQGEGLSETGLTSHVGKAGQRCKTFRTGLGGEMAGTRLCGEGTTRGLPTGAVTPASEGQRGAGSVLSRKAEPSCKAHSTSPGRALSPAHLSGLQARGTLGTEGCVSSALELTEDLGHAACWEAPCLGECQAGGVPEPRPLLSLALSRHSALGPGLGPQASQAASSILENHTPPFHGHIQVM